MHQQYQAANMHVLYLLCCIKFSPKMVVTFPPPQKENLFQSKLKQATKMFTHVAQTFIAAIYVSSLAAISWKKHHFTELICL